MLGGGGPPGGEDPDLDDGGGGPFGGGPVPAGPVRRAGGGPGDWNADLLERMVAVQEGLADVWTKLSTRDTDAKLKLDVKLPTISCEDKVSTLKEMEDFEVQMKKSNGSVSTWEQFWHYFEAALRGRPKI